MPKISRRFFPNPGVEGVIANTLSRFGDKDGFTILEWGDVDEVLIFLEPWAKYSFEQELFKIERCKEAVSIKGDPFFLLQQYCNLQAPTSWPIHAGFLGYHLLHQIENVARPKENYYPTPELLFFSYRKVLVVPRKKDKEACLVEVDGERPFWVVQDINDLLTAPTDNLGIDLPASSFPEEFLEAKLSPNSNFSREQYVDAIKIVKDLISEGEVYQVNLSQQFKLPLNIAGDLFYRILRSISPAAYGSYMQGTSSKGTSFSVVSISPELFMRCKGDSLAVSPIKGTRRRSAILAEDERLKHELQESSKDHAELSMIVDLERNDMGRIARPGTVKVKKHARIETLPQVHHLVSDLECKLRPEVSFAQILRALFPCGSITGAPKIAAMKVISDLEGTSRGVYTGALGYLAGERDFSFNVAIRTGVISSGELVFQSGGGIVIDSDPLDEYLETLTKARPFFHAWNLSPNH